MNTLRQQGTSAHFAFGLVAISTVLNVLLTGVTSFAQDTPRPKTGAREVEQEHGDRPEAEKLEAEQLEAEQLEAEQLEAEQLEAEQLEAEQPETNPPNKGGTPTEESTMEAAPSDREIKTGEESSGGAEAAGDEAAGSALDRGRSQEAQAPSLVNAHEPTARASVDQKAPYGIGSDSASTMGAEPRFSLTPGGYVQTRLAFDDRAYSRADEEDYTEGLPSDSSTLLTLPRAAVFVEGSAYVPELTFRLQIGFDPHFSLEDAYVNYAFADSFQLRIGRDKRPFSRQYLNRRRFLQWTDISRAERYFGPSRDVGVLIHNDYLNTTGVEYALGVYQGQFDHFQYIQTLREDTPRIALIQSDETDTEIEPTVVFRVGYNNGPGTYSESAWGGGDFVYGVALSGLLDLNTNRSGSSRAQAELDGIFKAGGFSISYMLGLQLRQTGDDFLKNRDQGGAATSVQAGYVFGQRIEPVIRLSAALMGEGISNANTVPFSETEAAAGLNVYFFGHDLKWTNEVSRAAWHESRGQPEDLRIKHTAVRSQLQFGF